MFSFRFSVIFRNGIEHGVARAKELLYVFREKFQFFSHDS